MALRIFVILVITIVIASGCGKIEAARTAGDGGVVDNPPAGVVDEDAGFYVRARQSADYRYYSHKGSTTPDVACVAASGERIDCYVEAMELDLWYHGMELQYNVPSNLCAYLRVKPYWYYRFRPGYGPTDVHIDTDQNGDVGYDSDNNGVINGPTETCPYDYSASKGPNCCLGRFDAVSRAWDATANNYRITGTQANQGWGGVPGTCLAGPAIDLLEKSEDQYPKYPISYVQGVGLNDVLAMAPPGKKSLLSSVHLANYWEGAVPAALGVPAGTTLPEANRFYSFQCLDRAKDFIAEIRVFVRKWNTNPEHTNLFNDPTKFNKLGLESAPWNVGDDNDLNDLRSWLDFLNTYPAFNE